MYSKKPQATVHIAPHDKQWLWERIAWRLYEHEKTKTFIFELSKRMPQPSLKQVERYTDRMTHFLFLSIDILMPRVRSVVHVLVTPLHI